MKRDEIINTIASLANSQGFYGRLLRDLIELKENYPDTYEETMESLEAQNFKDTLDLVMFIEEGE